MTTKTKKQPSAEYLKRKEELIKLSNEIKFGITLGKFPEAVGINDAILKYVYPRGTYNTFHGWRLLGRMIKKGSKAYVIWSAPKERNIKDDILNDSDKEKEEFKFWSLCYLFHEEQTEPFTKNNQTKDKKK